jgi:Icc-related predicted phosphoesterase
MFTNALQKLLLCSLATVLFSCFEPRVPESDNKTVQKKQSVYKTTSRDDFEGPLTFGAITDIHGDMSSLEWTLEQMHTTYELDYLFVLGDYVQNGTDRKENGRMPTADINEALSLIATHGYQTILLPGNHDPKNIYQTIVEELTEDYPNILDGTQYDVIDIGPIAVIPNQYGSDRLYRWSGYKKEESELFASLLMKYEQVPPDTLSTILLSHQPPQGTTAYSIDHVDEQNVGSEELARFVDSYDIDLTIAGHVHDASGNATTEDKEAVQDTLYPSLIVNAGCIYSKNESDTLTRGVIITYDDDTFTYSLLDDTRLKERDQRKNMTYTKKAFYNSSHLPIGYELTRNNARTSVPCRRIGTAQAYRARDTTSY